MNAAEIEAVIVAARTAQALWRQRPVRERARRIGRVRQHLAADASAVITAVGDRFDRTPAETLTAEIIPLADAARYIARRAERLLAPRRLGARGRPAWLVGVRGEVRRVPYGVVAVIAPGNYRLLLAGVQILQALTAGNAVVIKPAPGAGAPLRWLRAALIAGGVPGDLVAILADDHATGAALAQAPIDKLVLTGSAATGRAAAADLARHGVPAALELSGNDAVFVTASADLRRVADTIAWGLALNGGATCIAPRRIFVDRRCFAALAEALADRLIDRPPRRIAPAVRALAGGHVEAARAAGWRLIGPAPAADAGAMAPCVLASDTARIPVLPGDLFAPIASLIAVGDMADARARDAESDYALGASVFGNPGQAAALAREIDAGIITINDMIAPTADPRAPFAGARASGYGATRGAEGLVAMTRPQAVLMRRGRARPHLRPASRHDAALFTGYLRLAHGRGLRQRLAGWRALMHAAKARLREARNSAS